MPKSEYETKCLRYFDLRYSKREGDGVSLYPLPQSLIHELGHTYRHLSRLLNDRGFYRARFLALSSLENILIWPCPTGRILWEIYGAAPDEFRHAWKTFKESDVVAACMRNFGERPINSLCAFESFLQRLQEDPKLSPIVRAIVTSIREDGMKKLHNDLSACGLGGMWNANVEWLRGGRFPLESGLCIYIQQTWRPLIRDYVGFAPIPQVADTTKDPCRLISEVKDTGHLFDDLDIDSLHGPRFAHMLFSAAGTGKTKKLFDLLSQNWGFYILSPNLEPTDHSSAKELDACGLDPQRIFGSVDTYSHFQDHLGIKLKEWQTNPSEAIVTARLAILWMFLKRWPRATPRDWLRFQTSCTDLDAFDATYRLFRLGLKMPVGIDDNKEAKYDSESLISTAVTALQECSATIKSTPDSGRLFDKHLYFCLDEAQTALSDETASSTMNGIISTLGEAYRFSSVTERLFPGIRPTLILSGTAMNFQEMERYIRKLFERHFTFEELSGPTPLPKKWKECGIHVEFPSIVTDEDFWRLYKTHVLSILNEDMELQKLDAISQIHHHQWQSQNYQVDPRMRPFLSKSGRFIDSNCRLCHNGAAPGLLEWHLDQGIWIIRQIQLMPIQDTLRLLGRLCRSFNEHSRGTFMDVERNLTLCEILDQPSLDLFLARFLGYLKTAPRFKATDGSPVEAPMQMMTALANHGEMLPEDALRVVLSGFSDDRIALESDLELKVQLRTALRNIFIRQLICDNTKPLRGRHRWSTLYIESILFHQLGTKSTDCSLDTIRILAQRARDEAWRVAVRTLTRQIHRMSESGKQDLVDLLYRMAIRAEIMSRPTIFLGEKSAKLITEGFALVEKLEADKVLCKLSEPVAVHAIMAHLRGSDLGHKEYERVMLEALTHTQDDYEVQSMFGKATEWFIAAALDTLLRRPVYDNALFKAERRQTLLEYLSRSISYTNDQTRELGTMISIEEFSLPGLRPHYDYGSSNSIWDWMCQCRTNGAESASTFLFPSWLEGPDILFVLESKDEGLGTCAERKRGKVLCALQIKTGNLDFKKAMGTLRPELWQKSSSNAASASTELKHWEGVPFVFVLISTGAEVTKTMVTNWFKNHSRELKDDYFFCFLDSRISKKIWGDDFYKLSIAVKDKKLKSNGSC